jgi:hypothetical protein
MMSCGLTKLTVMNQGWSRATTGALSRSQRTACPAITGSTLSPAHAPPSMSPQSLNSVNPYGCNAFDVSPGFCGVR